MPWVPQVCRDVTAKALDGLPPQTREMFELRLERWWPDVRDGLAELYSAADAQELAPRLIYLAACAYAERDPELRRLDVRRQLRPDWLQGPDMVGYAAYTERFAGTLPGVADRIGYLEELGVTYLHLLPLLTPREGDSDGGYAVADYRSIRADLGTMDDLRDLTQLLRAHGISLALDLVLNHVAAEHPWARRARAGDPRYRGYFHVFEDRTMPDAYEATLPEVFPDFAPGNFTWDEELQAWVWTTFNSFQWDLDWSNPDVLAEFVDIVLFLANAGVEVLRLDAIAFMWKKLGTNCQGLPEVHAITQVLRAIARIACPALSFLAEAIVAPSELVHYLGSGRYTGKVSDLAYHNSLMVQIWSMLATKEVRLAAHALNALPPAPTSATWITYTRCHDDIGWAISDEDPAAVGLNGFEHRAFLSDWYSGQFPGSPAQGLVFQENPHTRDRRISGTAASLVGVEAALSSGESGDGIEAVDDEALNHSLAALRLMHALIMGWGGIPVIWSGDELAARNDPNWAHEPGHENDNRWAHRPRLDDDAVARRSDPSTVEGRAYGDLRALAQVRSTLPHLHASVATHIGPVDDPGVLVTVRRHPLGAFVGLYNVTPQWRPWPAWRLGEYGLETHVDALTGQPAPIGDDGNVWLAPYAVAWLTAVLPAGSAR